MNGKAAADALRQARTIVVERGWRQGPPAKRDQRVCLARALGIVPLSYAEWRVVIWYVITAIDSKEHLSDIVAWNDVPGRTVEEVLAVLDKAVLLAEAMP